MKKPKIITPENYKAYDQWGREYELGSENELGFIDDIKLLIDAYFFQRLKYLEKIGKEFKK